MYVYFIQAGQNGPIKIGLGADPEDRREDLQIGNAEELVLLAMYPGTLETERSLHRHFASGHIRGEWFRPDTPGLRREIGRARLLETAAIDGEARGLCRHCSRPVLAPRTRLCSEQCERERKRLRSAQWRTERDSSPILSDLVVSPESSLLDG